MMPSSSQAAVALHLSRFIAPLATLRAFCRNKNGMF
jgi:hypothetical protein